MNDDGDGRRWPWRRIFDDVSYENYSKVHYDNYYDDDYNNDYYDNDDADDCKNDYDDDDDGDRLETGLRWLCESVGILSGMILKCYQYFIYSCWVYPDERPQSEIYNHANCLITEYSCTCIKRSTDVRCLSA